MKFLYLLFLPTCIVFSDINRFIDSTIFSPVHEKTVFLSKSSALISPPVTSLRSFKAFDNSNSNIVALNRESLEKKLAESIAHRYQVTGKVVVFLTREWLTLKVSPNYLIKISECSPDELCNNTFTRFGVWDSGQLVGEFAEPLRVGHYVDVLFSKSPLQRGVPLNSIKFDKKCVDILKQHAGAVPVGVNVNGYQLDSNIKANTPIKWNYLSKVTLVKKGQIVDVFASGNGIYVTMKGMALENGVEGGNVTVQNLSSDKKFQAKVLNENSVKVHL